MLGSLICLPTKQAAQIQVLQLQVDSSKAIKQKEH